MKKRLVILSDLYGKGKSDWLIYYNDILQDFFDITYYDCCKLAQIDTSDNSQEKLHEQWMKTKVFPPKSKESLDYIIYKSYHV